MSQKDVTRKVARDTVSGYAALFVGMGIGLYTFRMIYHILPEEDFGYWGLLWSLFGYGILVDFGFGYTAQKRVAELSVQKNWDELSRVVTTILAFYIAAATVIFTGGYLASEWMVDAFHVSAQNREAYHRVLIIFLGGIALSFPLGIFPEMLKGQQRVVTANIIQIASAVINAVVVSLVVYFEEDLETLVICTLLPNIVIQVLVAFMVLARLPEVHLRPRNLSFKTLVDTSKFSLVAYANTLATVVRNKSANPVISTIFGVARIAPYQLGSRIGETYGSLTIQLARVLSPTAAHLHASGDRDALGRVLLSSMRFSGLLGTLLWILTVTYMDGVIRLIAGEDNPTPEMIGAGIMVTTWFYSEGTTHSVFRSIYMMAGQERRLMVSAVIEAAAGLFLGIAFALLLRALGYNTYGILGVAAGPLLSAVVLGWGIMWGWASAELKWTRRHLFGQVVWPAWKGCLPMLVVIALLRLQPYWASGSTALLTLLEGGVAGLVGVLGIYAWSLRPEEREGIVARFSKKQRVAEP
jgi:O-antigen/teichoic acid export membrane protein